MALLTTQFADWHQFFEDSTVSPQDFYESLTQAVQDHQVPETETDRIERLERGLLSSNRVYLEITRDTMRYCICVSPFGTGFFVSSRLLSTEWESWPLLFIPAFFVPLIPLLIFLYIVLVFNSYLAAAILSTLSVGPAIGMFLLSVVLWIFWYRRTWYRLDTIAAFQEAIHRLLVAQVNKVMETSGKKPLSPEESKPVLHKLLRR